MISDFFTSVQRALFLKVVNFEAKNEAFGFWCRLYRHPEFRSNFVVNATRRHLPGRKLSACIHFLSDNFTSYS